MIALINQLLTQWHKIQNQRHKLQYAYLAAALIVITVAGVVAFFRPEMSQLLAGIGLLFTGVFFLNGISWALLRAFVEPYAEELSAKTRSRTKK